MNKFNVADPTFHSENVREKKVQISQKFIYDFFF